VPRGQSVAAISHRPRWPGTPSLPSEDPVAVLPFPEEHTVAADLYMFLGKIQNGVMFPMSLFMAFWSGKAPQKVIVAGSARVQFSKNGCGSLQYFLTVSEKQSLFRCVPFF